MTTAFAASVLYSTRVQVQNQNMVHVFPTKTPNSLKVSHIIDGGKMRNATLLSCAPIDKAITGDQSVPDTTCDKVKKHTISVYVGDESGIINCVVGVIARRGYNIESLAVGLNKDKAMFTIVVLGTDKVLQQVAEQLNKLVNVIKVEDISNEPHVERELMLIKLNADSTTRSEIMWLVNIFRAKVVDTSKNTLTIKVTGDPGKLVALMMNLEKFGIKEVARTGKIALRREKMGETAPYWRFVATTQVPFAEKTKRALTGKCNESSEIGVYPVEPYTDFQPILNAHWGVVYNEDSNGIRSHTLSILVANVPGVLNQITAAISRRDYNIQSVAVGPSEKEGLSRITTVILGTDEKIEKLVKQMEKVINFHEVKNLTYMPFVERELMLIKVAANIAARRYVLDIAQLFRAKTIDFSDHTVTLEVTGDIRKMAALQTQLEVFGICEVARTGRVALVRESGVDSTYLRGYAIPL